MADEPRILWCRECDSGLATLDDETLKILAERIEAFIQHWGVKPSPQQIRDFFRRE